MSHQLVEDLKFLAKVYGWQLEWHKPEYGELLFKRDGCGLTIWYTKMTVRTALTHPKLGETQMYRKRVDIDLMETLFDNPRTHTNKGYMHKGNGNKHRWRNTNTIDLAEIERRNKRLKNIRQRYGNKAGIER